MKPMISAFLPASFKSANSQPHLRSRLAQLWQEARSRLIRSTELQVWQSQDANCEAHWSAYDPETGATVQDLTESEMRIWIERRHYLA
jgi:nitrite reductase/ring-hydroxylating ferredoxin subunit